MHELCIAPHRSCWILDNRQPNLTLPSYLYNVKHILLKILYNLHLYVYKFVTSLICINPSH